MGRRRQRRLLATLTITYLPTSAAAAAEGKPSTMARMFEDRWYAKPEERIAHKEKQITAVVNVIKSGDLWEAEVLLMIDLIKQLSDECRTDERTIEYQRKQEAEKMVNA